MVTYLGKVGFYIRTFGLLHSITKLSTLHWAFSGHSQVNMPLNILGHFDRDIIRKLLNAEMCECCECANIKL